MFTRRQVLQGMFALVPSVCLPWGLSLASSGLTKADRILIQRIDDDTSSYHTSRYLTKIRVHELFRKRMSLSKIKGIEVEAIREKPDEIGYITYYSLDYEVVDCGKASTGCFFPAVRMDEWIQRNISDSPWVPINFAGGHWERKQ